MRIDSYKFGRIVIDGKRYANDLIILPDRLKTDWWREKGHVFGLRDCEEIFAAEPDFIVFGLGAYTLVKLSQDLLDEIRERRLKYAALDTKEACGLYNEKAEAGIRTVAALHLTC